MLLTFLVMNAGLVDAASTSFVIVDDEDFAPFCWFDNSDRKIKGISYDIITEAFKIMGKPLDYQTQPWGRVTSTIQKDAYQDIDATVTVYTDVRKKFLVSSRNPIITTNRVLFARPDNKRFKQMASIKTLADLKSYKLVDYLGDGWAEARFKASEGFSIYFAPKLTNTLQILANETREADIFVESEIITKYNIKALGLQGKIVAVPGVNLGSVTFNLLVHKKSPKLEWLKSFDAAIDTMRKNGRIKAIYDKYIE